MLGWKGGWSLIWWKNSVIFVTPYSHWPNKWSMGTYTFKMIQQLEKVNVSCSVLEVKATWVWYFKRLILPIFDSWSLLWCKETIIYVQYTFFINFIFLLPFLFLSRKKVVIQIHEYWEFLPLKRIVKYIDLLYCRVADAIVVQNNDQYKTLKWYGFKNVYLLHMPVDANTVEWNIFDHEKINILMHGWIIRKKWYEVWIRALSLLPEKYTMTLLWGIWDSWYFKELLSIIQELWLKHRISVIDKALPDAEYEDLIKQADIIIYPYIVSTASAALADWALKFEKPFLTSDIDSFIDYIWWECVFKEWDYKDLSNKILNLNLGNAKKISIELKTKYNWNKVWQKLLEIFHSLN